MITLAQWVLIVEAVTSDGSLYVSERAQKSPEEACQHIKQDLHNELNRSSISNYIESLHIRCENRPWWMEKK